MRGKDKSGYTLQMQSDALWSLPTAWRPFDWPNDQDGQSKISSEFTAGKSCSGRDFAEQYCARGMGFEH